jgi:hypothetical protein
MQHSAEVRWFHRGPVGQGSLQWFTDGKTLAPERRTDRYLTFPGCESGGVKLRSYEDKRNFEIKLLRGAAEPLRLPAGVSGRADCWVKWSQGGAAGPLVQELMGAPAQGFVDVEKTRYLRKFSTDAGRPGEVEVDARPSSGCGVELTGLSVRNEAWWSFAFEAFGEPGSVRATLEAVAREFLATRRPVDAFGTANSCSYPAWLAGF